MGYDDVFIRLVPVAELFVCSVCLNGDQLSILGSTNKNIMKTVHDLDNLISNLPETLKIPLHTARKLCEVWNKWSFHWLRKDEQASMKVPDDVIEFLFSLPGEGNSYEDINPPVINEQEFVSILQV